MLKKTSLAALVAALALTACNDKAENKPGIPPQPTASAGESDVVVIFEPKPVDDSVRDAIIAVLAKQLGESGASIRAINTAPSGLYEVVMNGNQIIYVTPDMKNVMVGHLLDISTGKNLTAERMAALSAISWKELPLDTAIKTVYGAGTQKIAVFSDPDCPYCKRLEHELSGATDLTVYTIPFPVESLHPGATERMKRLMCEPDPSKAWTDWMLNGKEPDAGPDCEAAGNVEKGIEFGISRGIAGTPTIVMENGAMLQGAVPLNQITGRNEELGTIEADADAAAAAAGD